ncbi:unnamed protein product [Plutella xylostella]|uniref:(diamondback moth) hypothetical protein n=1 Tax=Plutella xylostella TaxID=51655 RepID=A0A8S4GDN0_PLUXY|nr:unnamed protein product [Plutella xylostella]
MFHLSPPQARERLERERERYLRAQASRQLPDEAEPIDSDDSGGGSPLGASPARTPSPSPSAGSSPQRHQHQDSSDGATTPPRPPSAEPPPRRPVSTHTV